jgi:hypothetical protein
MKLDFAIIESALRYSFGKALGALEAANSLLSCWRTADENSDSIHYAADKRYEIRAYCRRIEKCLVVLEELRKAGAK